MFTNDVQTIPHKMYLKFEEKHKNVSNSCKLWLLVVKLERQVFKYA